MEYRVKRFDDELQHYGVLGMKWGVRKSIVADTPKGRQPDWQHKKTEREKRWIDDNGINPHRPNGTTRGQKKIAKAEKYLGRKLQANDGFSKDGSDITKKRLKNVKQWDEQEKRYKAVKKKDDPVYDYVRGYNLKYGNALRVKDVNRIIKKMEKDPTLDVNRELEKSHRAKAGKQAVTRALAAFGSAAITAAAISYVDQH